MNFLRILIKGLVVALGLVAQLWFSLVIYWYLGEHIAIFKAIYYLGGMALALALIKNSKNYSYTLPWIIILVLFPIVGGLLYLFIGRNKNRSKLLKRIKTTEEKRKKYLSQDISKIDGGKLLDNGRIRYLSEYTGFPVSTNNDIKYYPLGEQAFEVMVKELSKAQKFIFFEYFIVAKGKMWDTILEILKEKAASGVEVRVMYDDFGCMTTLKDAYPRELNQYGIKCYAFNRLNPVAGVIMNNRDHRKILVIDGKVAFSGGINVADEYINIDSKYGHWKDNAIKVSGDVVWNYTVMFLTMWNALSNEDRDYTKYKHNFTKTKKTGYAVAYGETPLDDEITGEDVYLNIINQAKKYVYITTPYLIIDTDVINSLILASKRGVDVRIIIPGIPDKKMVYSLSKSYARLLINGGVKVYKYTPGFIHAKTFVSDDHIATVGTINLDYRSLYLHFECGCYMEDLPVIKDIKNDVLDTFSKSEEMIIKRKSRFIKNMWHAALRLVAPLL